MDTYCNAYSCEAAWRKWCKYWNSLSILVTVLGEEVVGFQTVEFWGARTVFSIRIETISPNLFYYLSRSF